MVIIVHLIVTIYAEPRAPYLRVTVLNAPCYRAQGKPSVLRLLFYHEFVESAHPAREGAIYKDFSSHI